MTKIKTSNNWLEELELLCLKKKRKKNEFGEDSLGKIF